MFTCVFTGRFTATQRLLYLAVLDVQEACIEMCTPEFSLADVYTTMMDLLVDQLINLNIIPHTLTKDRNKLLKVATPCLFDCVCS